MKQSAGTFLHSVCGKKCRDAWELRHREPKCRDCNKILMERNRASNATTAEIKALRQEVGDLKALLLKHVGKHNLNIGTPSSEESDSDAEENDGTVRGFSIGPVIKPKPLTIQIDGHPTYGVASGEYTKLSKNIYVQTFKLDEGVRKNGFPDHVALCNEPHLTFLNLCDDYGHGYHLVAVKNSADCVGYAREMSTGSWQVWDEEDEEFCDVPARHLLRAAYETD